MKARQGFSFEKNVPGKGKGGRVCSRNDKRKKPWQVTLPRPRRQRPRRSVNVSIAMSKYMLTSPNGKYDASTARAKTTAPAAWATYGDRTAALAPRRALALALRRAPPLSFVFSDDFARQAANATLAATADGRGAPAALRQATSTA